MISFFLHKNVRILTFQLKRDCFKVLTIKFCSIEFLNSMDSSLRYKIAVLVKQEFDTLITKKKNNFFQIYFIDVSMIISNGYTHLSQFDWAFCGSDNTDVSKGLTKFTSFTVIKTNHHL